MNVEQPTRVAQAWETMTPDQQSEHLVCAHGFTRGPRPTGAIATLMHYMDHRDLANGAGQARITPHTH